MLCHPGPFTEQVLSAINVHKPQYLKVSVHTDRGLSYSCRNKLLLPDLNLQKRLCVYPTKVPNWEFMFICHKQYKVSPTTPFFFLVYTEIAKCWDQISEVSYLSSMVVNISILRINVSSHVEVLSGQHRLLLLHVHTAPFDQSVGSQLQNKGRETSATLVFLHIEDFVTITVITFHMTSFSHWQVSIILSRNNFRIDPK